MRVMQLSRSQVQRTEAQVKAWLRQKEFLTIIRHLFIDRALPNAVRLMLLDKLPKLVNRAGDGREQKKS